jgi:hypothetical protein
MALAMQGEFKEALAAFRRAGDEQSARANLGFARFERGEYAQAIEEYERALVAGGPADVQVVRNLKAARSALVASGNRPAPQGREVAEDDDATEVEPAGGEEVAETKPVDPNSGAHVEPSPGRRADDPWLWEAPPPGAAADHEPWSRSGPVRMPRARSETTLAANNADPAWPAMRSGMKPASVASSHTPAPARIAARATASRRVRSVRSAGNTTR